MRRFGLSLGSPSRAKSGVADQMRLVRRLHFYDYQNNVKAYPTWQKWLGENQPPLLVLWGKYDPSLTVAGAEGYRRGPMRWRESAARLSSPSQRFAGARPESEANATWPCVAQCHDGSQFCRRPRVDQYQRGENYRFETRGRVYL